MEDQRLHILLLRHGQTASNANGIVQGHLPVPLNELGRRQAQLLAGRIARWRPKVQVLISSDLARATETAAPIAEATGLGIEHDSAWRERGFGSFEGKTVGEVNTWRIAAGQADPPGAESIPAFEARVRDALLALPQRFAPPHVVAVVTHGGPCLAVLRLFARGEIPMLDQRPVPEVPSVANCSIMHLSCDGRAWSIECVNEAAHLDAISTRDSG